MKILVTGGAGFIGSHLIDKLIEEKNEIICIDDLSLGKIKNIKHHQKKSTFKFIKLNILDKKSLTKIFKTHNFDCVFHFAANSDIQKGTKYTNIDLNRTFLTTFSILACMKKYKVKNIVFASSSAIYGDLKIPIKETSGPLMPTSLYGAAKLSSEGYISAFCENFGIKAWIFRFPNVIGERATHGVVFDFIKKLKKNPKELLILGDGNQKKPYMYVKDLIEGIIFGWKNSNGKINCFNIGVNNLITVTEIAKIITKEMGLNKVKFKYTGGKIGWTGDIPFYKYDMSKINRLGWDPKKSSKKSVEIAVKAILKEN